MIQIYGGRGGARGVARAGLRGYSPAALRFSPAAFEPEIQVCNGFIGIKICFLFAVFRKIHATFSSIFFLGVGKKI